MNALPRAVRRLGQAEALAQLRLVAETPGEHLDDPYFGKVAARLVRDRAGPPPFVERAEPAPFMSWCDDAEQKGTLCVVAAPLRASTRRRTARGAS